MPSKPELLYLSPVAPALTGNGLAMRAGTVLECLAEHYSVSLLVVPLYPPLVRAVAPEFRALCTRTAVVARDTWFSLAKWKYRKLRFDAIHVFRLAMLPFAKVYLERGAGRLDAHLDFDDIESATHRRIAELHRANDEAGPARFEELLARGYEEIEAEALALFDRVYVCSENDRAKLEGCGHAAVYVLPNAVRLPPAVPQTSGDGPFRFLFAGTLGYYPNDDAARWLCTEIVPRIRSAQSQFAVDIVGGGASDRLADAAAWNGVRLAGFVPDMRPWYVEAGAVVVPLRAGGGTRIKILEAFSHGRPVVSTTCGCEGIDVRHQQHVLIADTPEEFAAQCVRLMESPSLRQDLVENARALLLDRYTMEAAKNAVASFCSTAAPTAAQSDAA